MEDMDIYMNNGYQKGPDEVKDMNFFQRLAGIIIEPAETMKNLIHKPRIVFPIIIIALGLVSLYLLRFDLYKDTLRQALELSMQNNPKIQLTPELINQQVDFSAILGLVGVPFGTIIGWLVGTLIIFGLIKLFSGKGRFIQFLSITGYSYVITLLYIILTAIVSYASNTLPVDLPVTSAARLLPEDLNGTFLYGILTGVELFSIWKLVVTGIGITLLSKLDKVKVFSILIGMYAVQLLFSGLVQFIASMFK
jgi:hypothetical protein